MTGLASCLLKRRARASARLAFLASARARGRACQRADASEPINVFIGSLVLEHDPAKPCLRGTHQFFGTRLWLSEGKLSHSRGEFNDRVHALELAP
jgi:hypothetical protein